MHVAELFGWTGTTPYKKDLGNEAVVLSSEEFKDIGFITIKLPSGKLTELDSDIFPDGDFLIIYPDDLG